MRKFVIRGALFIAALIVAVIAWLAWQWLPPRPKLVVSRETTWIVEPLLLDGTVDYEAAWKNERSVGLTPENNAAPFLFAALGFDVSRFSDAERAALPQPFPRFAAYYEWYYDHEASLPEGLRDRYTEAPPLVEALDLGEADATAVRLAELWVDAESACLDEIERVVKRDHMVASGLFHDPSNAWGMLEICHALHAWAALAAAKGEDDAAFAHLASGLRLARLQRSLGISAHLLAAEAGEVSIWTSALRLARRAGKVSPTAFRDLLAAADASNADARLRAAVAAERRFGLEFLVHPMPISSPFPGAKPNYLDRLISRIDPNRACRRFNQLVDQMESDWCTGSWSERLDLADGRHQRFMEAKAARGDDRSILTTLRTFRSRDAFGDAIVDFVMRPRDHAEEILPALLVSERSLIELAALAYATETGRDPKNSDDLTPLLFPSPWRDRVTGASVNFERQADGTLVARGPLIDLQNRFEEWSKRPVSKRAH